MRAKNPLGYIAYLFFLFLVSCIREDGARPVSDEAFVSEFEIPLDSVMARSDRFLSAQFVQTRSEAENREVNISTLYRMVGVQTRSVVVGEIPVHIVNYTVADEPAGYVIMIGDERIENPIVSYSYDGNWQTGTIPAFEKMFLERLDAYISTGLTANRIPPCRVLFSP